MLQADVVTGQYWCDPYFAENTKHVLTVYAPITKITISSIAIGLKTSIFQ